MFSVNTTNQFDVAAADIATHAIARALQKCGDKYGFDADEAMDFIKSGGIKVSKMPLTERALPWCGKVNEDCCTAILYNGGLYTQCPGILFDDTPFCKKCGKDKPKNGTVQDRLAVGVMDYKIGNRGVLPYCDYMKKNKLTMEMVDEALEKHGLTMDPAQLVSKKATKGRGRPGKPVAMENPEAIKTLPKPMTMKHAKDVSSKMACEESDSESNDDEEEDIEEELTMEVLEGATIEMLVKIANNHNVPTDKNGKPMNVAMLRKAIAKKIGII